MIYEDIENKLCYPGRFEDNGTENEILLNFQENFMQEINCKQSGSSFKLSDVKSFTYGPFTTRFWMFRKHIIMMSRQDFFRNTLFQAWDCITLNVKNKGDIYLIIQNEECMSKFLKLLIYQMQSIDGYRKTMVPMINMMLKKISKTKEGKTISEYERYELIKDIKHKIMRKVFHKYLVMKVRMKISYEAHLKSCTLVELWMQSIISSFRFLRNSK